jgi:enterochelin esterase family protein
MPDAPKQVWVGARKDVPKGTLKPHRVRSETLNEERTVSVYTPASYDPKGTPCALLLVVDGEDYRQLVPTPTILDNLIAERKLPPVVAVLIDNADKASRLRDLACSAPFADFLARELVPWARASYRLSADPKQTVICGSSLGGLCAAYCGFRCPDVFGNVLSQSGSFWYYPGWPKEAANVADLGWLTRQFEEAQALPIRFYLEAGLFEVEEPLNILAGNQRLHKVLAGKGYSVKYSEFAGGHEHLSWRGSLADGLIHLIGTEE